MSDFDQQYYVIFRDSKYQKKSNAFDFTRATGARRPSYRRLTVGQNPAFFNSEFETRAIGQMLFSLPSIILHKSIVGALTNENIWGGQLYPAVYIDAKGKYEEDFFLINMFNELDCWSRTDSVYELEEGDDEDAYMIKYKLDNEILQNIEEDKRLIFKMGGVDRPLMFLHERIIKAFKEQKVEGYKIFKVVDYEFGVEFD